jgi:hypothetical protein
MQNSSSQTSLDAFVQVNAQIHGLTEAQLREVMIDAAMKLINAHRSAAQPAKAGPVPATVPAPRKSGSAKRPTEPKAVTKIDAHQAIPIGQILELDLRNLDPNNLLGAWLKADPRRSRATWVGGTTNVLRWEYDGQLYSLTGLVKEIWRQATGKKPPSLRGPFYWVVPGLGSVADIAAKLP